MVRPVQSRLRWPGLCHDTLEPRPSIERELEYSAFSVRHPRRREVLRRPSLPIGESCLPRLVCQTASAGPTLGSWSRRNSQRARGYRATTCQCGHPNRRRGRHDQPVEVAKQRVAARSSVWERTADGAQENGAGRERCATAEKLDSVRHLDPPILSPKFTASRPVWPG